MGKPTGFLEYERELPGDRDPLDRLDDWDEFHEAGSSEAQVRALIDRFDPEMRLLIRAVREALRRRFPTAYEPAYDNYNFFVLGYSPTERPCDAVISAPWCGFGRIGRSGPLSSPGPRQHRRSRVLLVE